MANIIVKVGRTSNLKFRNVKAFRAITFKDIGIIVEKYGNISAVIIEHISRAEEQITVDTVSSLKNQGISVFLHNEFEDDVINRVAEQLGITASTSLDELQHSISNEIATRVYTAWCRDINVFNADNTQIEEVINEVKTTQTSKSLGDALSAFDKQKEQKVQSTIDNKDDLWEALGLEDMQLEFSDGEENGQDALQVEREKELNELKELLDDVTKQKNSYKSRLEYTEDKLEKLIEIKNSLENERNQLKSLVDTLNTNAQIERPVAGALLDEANNKIAELKSSIISLEQQIIEYEAEKKQGEDSFNDIKASYESEKSKLESNITALTAKIDDLTTLINDKDKTISELEGSASELETTKLELVELRTNKAVLEKKLAQLQNKVNELNESVERAAGESSAEDIEQIRILKSDVERLSAEVEELTTGVDLEVKSRLIINSLLAEATSQNSKAQKALIEKNNEISSLQAVRKNLETSIESNNEKIQQLQDTINKLEKELQDSKQSSSIEISNLQSEYTKQLRELRIDRDTRVQEVARVRGELNELREALDDKEEELAKMLIENGDNEENNRKVLESKQILEKTNDDLKSKVDMLTREVRSLTSKLSMTEDANERLERINKKLKETVQKKESKNKSQVEEPVRKVLPQFKLKLSCDYSGTGHIIPVFGSGSYGVTTMAVSIARRIPRAKVLLMDMNIVNPKADAFFKKSPILNSLTDIPEQLKRSSFGALIEKGARYVVDNIDVTIQQGIETQIGSRVDYFSGVYTKINPYKLSTVDFSELFMHLGNIYNYIIIDAGILGVFDVADELLRMFNRMAYMNIFVTLNDSCDLRNSNMRLGQTGINMDKSFWVLNMSDSSKVADMFKKVVGKSRPVIIPRDNSIQGSGISFDRVPMLKDRINEMVDIISK